MYFAKNITDTVYTQRFTNHSQRYVITYTTQCSTFKKIPIFCYIYDEQKQRKAAIYPNLHTGQRLAEGMHSRLKPDTTKIAPNANI